MTEAEWMASSDPVAMLEWLRSVYRVGDARKLRLFACGVCRQVWDQLTDDALCPNCDGQGMLYGASSGTYGKTTSGLLVPTSKALTRKCPDCTFGRINRSRRAVELAERYADGQATEDELGSAWQEASDAWEMGEDKAAHLAQVCTRHVNQIADGIRAAQYMPALSPTTQATLLRDIFGNPFQSLPELRRSGGSCGGQGLEELDWISPWLTWNDGTVRKLAQAIYQDRRFGDLPVLADALEEAGCHNQDILEHCRGSGTHVRGCWVVDLLLGKH